MPVAVVNLDKGATINGKTRNVGEEICDNLKEDGSLKFDFTDADTAKDGVLNQKYYASITIPADFRVIFQPHLKIQKNCTQK